MSSTEVRRGEPGVVEAVGARFGQGQRKGVDCALGTELGLAVHLRVAKHEVLSMEHQPNASGNERVDPALKTDNGQPTA